MDEFGTITFGENEVKPIKLDNNSGQYTSSIISAILSIAGTITSSVLSSQDAAEANKQALSLANQRRQDELMLNEKNEKFVKEQMALDKKKFNFAVAESNKNRVERAEEKKYNRQQTQQANFFNLINKNVQMRDSLVSIFPGLRS